ncbi:PAS domain-containing sensor histidine kinase [Hymenobacter sp.]|jgi:PAS domain S-box-containing protein|uniref:PAS domain-containing sensor histidine kinase n=1 Tax=Hymenobacter sp. TaxID=1898978 RepID=UPI002EDA7606
MDSTCHSVLNALPDAIARYAPGSFKITFVNGGFEQLLGCSSGAIVGKTIAEVVEQNEAVALWEQALQQVQRTRVRVLVPEYLHVAGQQYQVEVVPEIAPDNCLVSLLSIVRDATAHEVTKDELVRSRQQISQQHEALTRATGHLENFVYTVAHDLRAPVDNLSVLTNLLLERPHDHDSQLLMEHMLLSVRQLETTIADLVEVLEVQSTYKVVAHQLCLQEVYAEVAAELATKAADAVMEADFTELTEIRYIRSYLLSIFRNILGNAFKYRAGQRPLVVRVKAWTEGDYSVVSFQDNGIGIDLPNLRHKLFMPFSRLTSQAEGKGIGLHLVNNIVQKNGGRIQVESTPDVGTTFTCFLKEYE